MNLRTIPATSAAAVLSLFLLAGCSAPADPASADADSSAQSEPAATEPAQEEAPEPVDLTGEWMQSNSGDGQSYQAATVADGVISIDWVNDEDQSRAVYWVGTYEAPADAATSFSWDSVNDHSKTDSALLASSDETKTFKYVDGILSYDVTAMGVTRTVELKKQ
ncbi:hypothetical protein [Microbacterium sp. SMR1]|uniref:hypothetical protein n=1 Tax=Microbacterium sp. SMR1 TaxID=1497340 RepID=UPI000DCBBCA4|nr:hypothetical protein [Microbacterium sp. SMR1]RAZ30568.1 hypothetical protein DO944_13555 [Microbacterium sp. SMR1]